MPNNEDVISSSLTSVELHLTSFFTEMNTIAPPKSCVNNLLDRNVFKATLFLVCLKVLPWKFLGVLVAPVNGKIYLQPRAFSVCDFQELSK